MENKKEEMSVTGLELAGNRREAEYDLVKSLLKAAEFKTSEDSIKEVEIKRSGKYLFTVHVHPLSDPDTRFARKRATTLMPNPNGKKLPPIEREFNNTAFKSWLIYLATVPEDQEKIWGNPTIKTQLGLMENWESIDALLTLGEKNRLFELITEISGLDDDDEEEMDEESFQ